MSRRRDRKPRTPSTASMANAPRAPRADIASRADEMCDPLVIIALAMVAVVLIPCVVPIWNDPYLDQDPRSETARVTVTALGPADAAWLQVAGVALSGVALALHVARGGRLDRLACVLIPLGAAACALHMPDHFENLTRCGAWIAAAAGGLAAAHLAQHAAPRRWMAAAFIAMLAPFALQSVWYVLHDHPMTMANFFANEDAMLAAKGWTRGSPQHLQFVRRMSFDDATGAVGLSNVYGSIVGAITLLGVGLLAATRGRRWKWMWVMVPTAFGAITLWLTHSRGAIVTFIVAGGIAVASWALWSVGKPRPLRWLPWLAMLLIIGAVVAVLVRGAMGPPPTNNDPSLSILFRDYYWRGAARVVERDPAHALLLGLGPQDFRQTYVQVKPDISPEDVGSTHNFVIDNVVMLGLGGAAWSLLLIVWLWRAGRNAASDAATDATDEPPAAFVHIDRPRAVAAFALGAVVFGVQYVCKFDELYIDNALLWMAGAGCFIVVVYVLSSPGWLTHRGLAMGLFLAATLLIVHNQIEMTWFQQGSVPIAWFIVAMAGARYVARGDSHVIAAPPRKDDAVARAPRGVVAMVVISLVTLIAATTMAATYAGPLTRHQHALAAAALALREGNRAAALDDLTQACATLPTNPRPYRWRVILALEAAMHYASEGNDATARAALDAAARALDEASSAGLADNEMVLWSARVAQQRWQLTHESVAADAAAVRWGEVTAGQPHSLDVHMEAADALWQMDRRQAAARLYRRCLTLSDEAYLDPVKQLSAAQRSTIDERLRLSQ